MGDSVRGGGILEQNRHKKNKIKASITEQLAGGTEDNPEKYKYSWCHPEAKLGKLYVGMLSGKGCSGNRVWWVWPGSSPSPWKA